MRGKFWLATIALFVLAVPAGIRAQGRGHGQGNRQWEDRDQENEQAERQREVRPYFSPRDRQIIIDYFRGYGNLPPGLAKRGGNLPPGLARQLRRNGHLPPGLEKRLVPFPVGLERRLPPLPSVYQRVILGPDVLIVNRKTGAILDILRGVITLSQR
jgi:hypothetical protein